MLTKAIMDHLPFRRSHFNLIVAYAFGYIWMLPGKYISVHCHFDQFKRRRKQPTLWAGLSWCRYLGPPYQIRNLSSLKEVVN